MNKHAQRIFNKFVRYAKALDLKALQKLINKGYPLNIFYENETPASYLARSGEMEALYFLQKHFLISEDQILEGLACGGFYIQVEKLLAANPTLVHAVAQGYARGGSSQNLKRLVKYDGATWGDVIKGFARANQSTLVEELLKKYPLLIDEAALGYTLAGNSAAALDAVNRGAQLISIAKAQAQTGNETKHLMKFLAKNPDFAGEILEVAAEYGQLKLMKIVLREFPEKKDYLISGLARGGNNQKVEKYVKKTEELYYLAIYGYASANFIRQLTHDCHQYALPPKWLLSMEAGFENRGYFANKNLLKALLPQLDHELLKAKIMEHFNKSKPNKKYSGMFDLVSMPLPTINPQYMPKIIPQLKR